MKPWKLLLVGVACAAAAAWAVFRSPVPEIDPLTADRLALIADGWCERSPGRDIPPTEWPAEIQRLRPQAVRVTPDGVYIERGTQLVEAWGLFVLRGGASFHPAEGTDPSYRPLQGRVYWYAVKG